jgi:hypothetical protein
LEPSVTTEPTYDDWRRGLEQPVYFARRFLEVEPHAGQQAWLNGSTGRENVLVTGNRWGKSFVSAVKLIHAAIYRIRSLKYDECRRYRTVVASITQPQANLVFSQVLRLVRQSPILSPLVSDLVWTPFPTLTFGNGATIEARTTQNRGEYLLGNDYDLFIFDEVAFETSPEYVVEEGWPTGKDGSIWCPRRTGRTGSTVAPAKSCRVVDRDTSSRATAAITRMCQVSISTNG